MLQHPNFCLGCWGNSESLSARSLCFSEEEKQQANKMHSEKVVFWVEEWTSTKDLQGARQQVHNTRGRKKVLSVVDKNSNRSAHRSCCRSRSTCITGTMGLSSDLLSRGHGSQRGGRPLTKEWKPIWATVVRSFRSLEHRQKQKTRGPMMY